jgi:CheY-like chemotaxis protein/two-component sensor histidine kinase
MIDKSAEMQQRLIDDLLDVSRMSSGQLRLNLRITRLTDAVRGAIASVQPSADARKINIEFAVQGEIGLVRADADRIQQIVWNLLSNAVKFTPSGGSIWITLARDGEDVSIVVKDNGAGIRRDFLPHVFERFRQAEVVTTRQHGGLGLGLAIAKQLVELHGGSIAVDSEGEGKGATFTVHLPLRSDPQGVADEDGRQLDADDLEESLKGAQVLLVEDDTRSREATTKVLELTGAKVQAVDNASAAFDAYGGAQPTAIVCDIGLPGEDGYSLIQRVREFERARKLPRVPAVALTAFVRAQDSQRALASGFDEHLPKPVDVPALVGTLSRLIERANQQRS